MTIPATEVAPAPGAPADSEKNNPAPANRNWFRRHKNLLIFSGLAALYLLPFMTFFQTALLESGAVRILHGAVFARDFVEDEGPGSFWWNALFMRFFGADFFGARVCLFVTSLGSGVALYYLAQKICRRYAWLPAVILVATFFGGMWPLMSYHTDSTFFGLLAVVCVVRWFERRNHLWLWAAGFLAAFTTYTLQPRGVYLIAAIGAWMVVLYLRKRLSLRPLLTVTVSYAASMGVGLLYFWSQGALGNLIYYNFIWPATRYSHVNDLPYGWGSMKYWGVLSHSAHGVYFLAVLAPLLTAPYLFIDALPFLLLVLAALRWRDALQPEIMLYLFCGAAFWVSEIHRKEIGHLACGSSLFLVVFFYFLLQYKGKAARIAVQSLAICSMALATFNLMMMAGTHPLHTRVGTVRVYKPFPVVTYLETHTHPGEYVLCYPYCPSYYFLDQTPDPTRFNMLIYGYYTKAQFEEAIREVQQRRVKYVVWQGGASLREYHRLLPGSNDRPPYGFLMDDYLHSHYHQVKAFPNGMEIWERDGNG